MSVPRPIRDDLFESVPEGPRLRAARCEACGEFQFPASSLCPYCGGDRTTPTLVGPAGHLRLFTTVTSRPPGYRGRLPYGFGVVELTGTRLQVIARLTEADTTRLRPGLPVRLVLEELCMDDDGAPVLTYAFAPEGA